jgi:hypothetical protein
MSIKFNDMQLVLLNAASQRDDHCLVPPTGPKRSQAQRAVAKLLEAGLVKEIKAKAGAPIWRHDEETGQTYALKLTAAGVKAIALDETPPSQGQAERRAGHPVGVADPQPERGSNPASVDESGSGVASAPYLRAGEPRSQRSSHCCSAALAQLSQSLSRPPAGCRTRRERRSPACASAGIRSRLIGATSFEGRSIGSSRRR